MRQQAELAALRQWVLARPAAEVHVLDCLARFGERGGDQKGRRRRGTKKVSTRAHPSPPPFLPISPSSPPRPAGDIPSAALDAYLAVLVQEGVLAPSADQADAFTVRQALAEEAALAAMQKLTVKPQQAPLDSCRGGVYDQPGSMVGREGCCAFER